MKRLLELLRHDDCDDPVVCDCSLHLNVVDDAAAAAAASSAADRPQLGRRRTGDDQQVSTVDTGQTASSVVDGVLDGRCRTFKLPDVQVRHTSPEQSAGRPSAGAVAVVSAPDVVGEPHYTVV